MYLEPARPARPRRSAAEAVVCLALAVFGLTWMADTLGFPEFHAALRHVWPWPAVLILAGSSLLNRHGLAGMMLIVLGACEWARLEGLVDLPFAQVLGPCALVLAGAWVLLWQILALPAAGRPPGRSGSSRAS
jgi:hypothetical protein